MVTLGTNHFRGTRYLLRQTHLWAGTFVLAVGTIFGLCFFFAPFMRELTAKDMRELICEFRKVLTPFVPPGPRNTPDSEDSAGQQ